MKDLKYTLCMVLAALIWGTAFVAQRIASENVDAFSFNSIRSFVGCIALLPVTLTLGRAGLIRQFSSHRGRLDLLKGGVVCGVVLTVSTLLQQCGLGEGTDAGKAGFITALYILIVPMLGLFVGRRVWWNVWLAVLIALAGMYLLCVKEGFTIQASDRLVLYCAVTFSLHILVIDYFAARVDGILLSLVQFFFCGIFSLVPLLFSGVPEVTELGVILAYWKPIVYTGVFSSGIAYTLQIISQQRLNPTVAALVMSLESVFAALSGWLMIHESLTTKEFLGCALVFIATILSQVPIKKRKIGG